MLEPKFIKLINQIPLLVFDQIDSTSLWLKDKIKSKEITESVVIRALEMTAARGQGNNKWTFQKDLSLGFSIAYRLPTKFNCAFIELNKWIAITCKQSLEKHTNMELKIKWPNDIYFEEKKIGGLLLEVIDGFLIAGVGINVNNAVLPNLPNSTSLFEITNQILDIEQLFHEMIDSLVELPFNLAEIDRKEIHDTFNASLLWKNEIVTCELQDTQTNINYFFLGVDEFGRAMVKEIDTESLNNFHHPSLKLKNKFKLE